MAQRPGQKEYQASRRIKRAQASGGFNEGATCQACVHWLDGCSLKFPEADQRPTTAAEGISGQRA